MDVRALVGLRQQRQRVELGVPAAGVAGQQDAQRVVEVVRPGGVAAVAAELGHPHHPRVVEPGLGDHERARPHGVHAAGDLRHQVLGPGVDDRVDGVQPQAVEVEVAHPALGALADPLADGVALSSSTLRPAPQGVSCLWVKYGPKAISAWLPDAPTWL